MTIRYKDGGLLTYAGDKAYDLVLAREERDEAIRRAVTRGGWSVREVQEYLAQRGVSLSHTTVWRIAKSGS